MVITATYDNVISKLPVNATARRPPVIPHDKQGHPSLDVGNLYSPPPLPQSSSAPVMRTSLRFASLLVFSIVIPRIEYIRYLRSRSLSIDLSFDSLLSLSHVLHKQLVLMLSEDAELRLSCHIQSDIWHLAKDAAFCLKYCKMPRPSHIHGQFRSVSGF